MHSSHCARLATCSLRAQPTAQQPRRGPHPRAVQGNRRTPPDKGCNQVPPKKTSNRSGGNRRAFSERAPGFLAERGIPDPRAKRFPLNFIQPRICSQAVRDPSPGRGSVSLDQRWRDCRDIGLHQTGASRSRSTALERAFVKVSLFKGKETRAGETSASCLSPLPHPALTAEKSRAQGPLPDPRADGGRRTGGSARCPGPADLPEGGRDSAPPGPRVTPRPAPPALTGRAADTSCPEAARSGLSGLSPARLAAPASEFGLVGGAPGTERAAGGLEPARGRREDFSV